jgi:hypothetical protein
MIFVAIRGDKRVSVTFEEIFNDHKTKKKKYRKNVTFVRRRFCAGK